MVFSNSTIPTIYHRFSVLMDDVEDTPYFTEFALFMGRGAVRMVLLVR